MHGTKSRNIPEADALYPWTVRVRGGNCIPYHCTADLEGPKFPYASNKAGEPVTSTTGDPFTLAHDKAEQWAIDIIEAYR